jgi:DNA-binding GntR family transcriptional regulator
MAPASGLTPERPRQHRIIGPEREGERPTAYRAVADQLRADIAEHRYPRGQPLPTESQLSEVHGVSRQTVRRAFQDLVADGLVYRVPGRGTFAYDDDGRHLRSSGSIEDLLALALDTELEMLNPPAIAIDIEAASRLRLDTDEIVKLRFRRFHDGLPYCVTTAYLPVWLGRRLLDHPELTLGARRQMTVLGVVQRLAARPISGADQSITATSAPVELAAHIDCRAGEPVLRVDRIYFDRDGRPLELAINHFNPARYTYRFHLRATRS